ncbi:alcohol dehydrogenase catalytic domain-containing protein [Halomicroarcula limicola]|uniref:Alcohol dehydrogenase catalytic domain-containing protein n=2 Tax=Haloarcula limicola TaxID=1429915 RepID=A0A8J7YFT2_9EURY|nr:alcohol dehydrogenase catalytic domain-containing protein [Halomicroarcula limicola]
MKGVVLPGDKEAHVQDWDNQSLGPDEVRVDIGAAALCRSDMSLYNGNPLVGSKPAGAVVPGHEPAGTISAVGDNVDHLSEGDRVAINCFAGCEHCEYCLQGEPNLCPDVEILGFDRHGGDAEELVTPASTCHPMPDKMSMGVGAIATDALGNLWSTLNECNVNGTDTVGIIGLGPMGLAGVLNADAMGADVVAYELVDHRREKGLDLGAEYAVDPGEEDAQERTDEITNGRGLDVVVDCSGAQPGIEMGFDLVKKHGTFAQIGETDEVTLNPSDHLIHKKVDYMGSWYFRSYEWPEIAEFIVEKIGNDRAEEIISHEYELEEEKVQEAFRKFDNHETQKVIFTP